MKLVFLLLQRIFPQGEEPSGETDLKNLVRGLGPGTVGLQGQMVGELNGREEELGGQELQKGAKPGALLTLLKKVIKLVSLVVQTCYM